MSDPLSLVGGNLNFLPIESSDNNLSLTNLSEKLREWNWDLPDELLLFGDDGGDSQFGLWLPSGYENRQDHTVVEICEMESKSVAIAGTNLCRFLKGRTAYHLLGEEAAATSLDALGLPKELWNNDPDDDDVAAVTRWADPDIPDPLPDPFQRGVTFDEVRERYGSSAM